jgi:hypothetical protein
VDFAEFHEGIAWRFGALWHKNGGKAQCTSAHVTDKCRVARFFFRSV